MLLKDFIKILSKVKNKETCDVEFWLGETTELGIDHVGQFGVSKTVTIGFKKERKIPFFKPITNKVLLKKLNKRLEKIQKDNGVKLSTRSKKS
jgi:hypothetical protein